MVVPETCSVAQEGGDRPAVAEHVASESAIRKLKAVGAVARLPCREISTRILARNPGGSPMLKMPPTPAIAPQLPSSTTGWLQLSFLAIECKLCKSLIDTLKYSPYTNTF